MHSTDVEAFQVHYEVYFKPFLQTNYTSYLSVIEYPNTSERHLHAVIGSEKGVKAQDTDKVKMKLYRNLKNMDLLNTDLKHAIVVKDMNDPKTLYSGIGYLLKSDEPTILTTFNKEELDTALKAYYLFSKKPHHTLTDLLEYKMIPKGDYLAYLYDHYKKHPELNINCLEAHMIEHTKVSMGHIPLATKKAYRLELELKLHIRNSLHTDILNEETGYSDDWTADDHDFNNMPKYLLINAIKELQNIIIEKDHKISKLKASKIKSKP